MNRPSGWIVFDRIVTHVPLTRYCSVTCSASNGGVTAPLSKTYFPCLIVVLDSAGGYDFYYNATGPDGALVEYTATVTDDVDTNPTLRCQPPSGGVWPIGITTLGCTATDASGNTSSVGMDVWVLSASEQLTFLHDLAANTGGPGTSLADKISRAQSSMDAGNVAEACSILNASAICQVNGWLSPAFAGVPSARR